MSIRTRIAPSPTGENLHIGNAYTALVNFVFAKQQKGQFIVRIEDTDRMRLVMGSEGRILESLHWLKLDPQESPLIGGPYAPYRQSERLPIYQRYAEELVYKSHAYYCFCEPDRLTIMRQIQVEKHLPPMYDGTCKKLDPKEAKKRVESGEKHVIRLNVPDEGITKFNDLIRGEISFENKLIDDQVLIKSDGYPTYHLGVVVDDHLMEVSHIIRGEEWISSTPKHILLYGFFGWKAPIFAHMPLLRNPDKSKLSKRKNPVWVSWYKEQGFLPEALINYLGTMAWSFPDGRDIFSLEEMIQAYKLENVQTTAPIFNTEKLRWYNGEYIRKSSVSDLTFKISAFFKKKYSEEKIEKILPLLRERMKTLAEFATLGDFFFERPIKFERPSDPKIRKLLKDLIESVVWNHDAMEKAIRDAADKEGLKAKDLFMELRIAVTGKTVGPPLLESMEILGKEETITRLS
jgi:glutamyl-tRNA synthetase